MGAPAQTQGFVWPTSQDILNTLGKIGSSFAVVPFALSDAFRGDWSFRQANAHVASLWAAGPKAQSGEVPIAAAALPVSSSYTRRGANDFPLEVFTVPGPYGFSNVPTSMAYEPSQQELLLQQAAREEDAAQIAQVAALRAQAGQETQRANDPSLSATDRLAALAHAKALSQQASNLEAPRLAGQIF